jgi:hypothetical protein
VFELKLQIYLNSFVFATDVSERDLLMVKTFQISHLCDKFTVGASKEPMRPRWNVKILHTSALWGDLAALPLGDLKEPLLHILPPFLIMPEISNILMIYH